MKKTVFVSMLTAASVTLAACSSESSDGDDKELTLGYMTAWSDMLLMANLIEYVASEHGCVYGGVQRRYRYCAVELARAHQ